jgi:hypothetical protein
MPNHYKPGAPDPGPPPIRGNQGDPASRVSRLSRQAEEVRPRVEPRRDHPSEAGETDSTGGEAVTPSE